MTSGNIRILFLSDTHLGFDSTQNPRIKRRRRSDDFYNNFLLALKPAFDKKVDIVLHGGDLFYRSKIPDRLIDIAFEPILKVSDMGIPFLIVPGNHERSFVPRSLFHNHINLLLFDEPKTYTFQLKNHSISFSGFPFHRERIRDNFPRLVQQTRHDKKNCDVKFLCIHHAFEGAKVGTQNFTFRSGPDVVSGNSVPGSFDAVFSGHIHRAQIIRKNLSGNNLQVPVIYPGSVERTSFVERNETKGYYIIEIDSQKKLKFIFNELPARPMYIININTTGSSEVQIKDKVEHETKSLEPDSIVQIRLNDVNKNRNFYTLTTDYLRSLLPPTANISLSIPGKRFNRENIH